jgi:hypothetical protein
MTRRSLIRAWPIGAVACLAPCAAALAQSVSELKRQLTVIQADAPGDRRAAIERADELRARLLIAAPDDEQAGTWLADRAALALDQAGVGGLDAVVLLGVPTREQRDQAQAIAERALELLARADDAVSQSVSRLEARMLNRATPLEPAEAADLESRLKRLVDVEQARRIPYLRALAQTLLAGAIVDAPRKAQLATEVVRTLKNLPAQAPALSASRYAALGLALVQAADAQSPDRQPEVLRAAADQFALALEQTSGLDQGLKVRALLGLVRSGRAERAELAGADAALADELGLLALEARAGLALAQARAGASARIARTAEAVGLLIAAAPTPEQISLGAPDRRPMVYQKIAENIPPGVPLKSLPAEASFARAIALARSGGLSDPSSRGEAAALLRSVAQRDDAPATLRGQALWEAAVVAAASGDPLREVEALADVFRLQPEGEYAVPAARRVFEALARPAPGGATDDAERRARLLPLRDEALGVLIARDRADAWRTEGVRLAIADITERGTTQSVLGAVAKARSYLDAITDATLKAAAARALLDALARVVVTRRERAAGIAGDWAEVAQLARAAADLGQEPDAPRAGEVRLILGEALLETGAPADALSTLQGLAGGSIDDPDAAPWPRYRLALAAALERTGDAPGAFSALREVADALEGEPGQSGRSGAYWLAWARMLEIQQASPDGPARAPDMLVQIQRLSLIDPTLGDGPTAGRIRAVRDWATRQRPTPPAEPQTGAPARP